MCVIREISGKEYTWCSPSVRPPHPAKMSMEARDMPSSDANADLLARCSFTSQYKQMTGTSTVLHIVWLGSSMEIQYLLWKGIEVSIRNLIWLPLCCDSGRSIALCCLLGGLACYSFSLRFLAKQGSVTGKGYISYLHVDSCRSIFCMTIDREAGEEGTGLWLG
jgi:hypothetical protein